MITWETIFLGGFSLLCKFSALGMHYFHNLMEKNAFEKIKNKISLFLLFHKLSTPRLLRGKIQLVNGYSKELRACCRNIVCYSFHNISIFSKTVHIYETLQILLFRQEIELTNVTKDFFESFSLEIPDMSSIRLATYISIKKISFKD